MFTDECLAHIDPDELVDVLQITSQEIIEMFQERIDEKWEVLKGLYDVDEDEEDEEMD